MAGFDISDDEPLVLLPENQLISKLGLREIDCEVGGGWNCHKVLFSLSIDITSAELGVLVLDSYILLVVVSTLCRDKDYGRLLGYCGTLYRLHRPDE